MANRLMPKEPARLSKFLAHTDRQLNEGYVPNASALKALVKVTAKTKMWSVEFTREAIDQSIVVFDQDKKSLTLMEVPIELINQMRAEGMISD